MSDLVVSVRLTADGKDLVGAVRVSREELDRLGQTSGRAATEAQKLNRETQSLTSALKNLAGVVVSSAGITRLYRDFLEAGMQAERMNTTLRFVTGSAAQAAEEFKHLKSQALEMGLELTSAASSYAKLAAAANGTALAGRQTREIFGAVAAASTVLGLSAAETEGTLVAVQQMISKGTVAAEELRGQLGERLPGAFQIAARAMGVTTAELGKMLEKGSVTAEVFLPRFAAELDRTFRKALPEASQSARAELNRLSNAWTEFKQAVAGSGFMAEAAAIMTGFASAIRSAQPNVENQLSAYGSFWKNIGKNWAASLVEGFAVAIRANPFMPGAGNALSDLLVRVASDARAIQAQNPPGMAPGDVDKTLPNYRAGGVIRGSLTASQFGGMTEQQWRLQQLQKTLEYYQGHGQPNQPKVEDPYPQLVKGLEQKLYLDKESTEVERLQLELGELSAAQLAKLGAKKIELLRLMAAEIDQKRADAAASKAWLETVQLQVELEERQGAATADFNQAASERIQAINQEALGYTKGERAKEKAIELAKLEAQYLAALSKVREGDIEAMDRVNAIYESRRVELEAAVDARAGAREASEQIKRRADEEKRLNDELSRGLTDSIFRGFEAGKDFARNFFDSLKNTAKTTVLKPVVQFLVQPFAAAATSALGMLGIPGLGNAAGMGNIFMNGGGIGGGLINASSLPGMGTFGGAQTLADFGNFFGSIGSVTESGATFGLMDAVGGFAAANPYTAAAIAAAALIGGSKLFGGGGGGPASFTGLDVSGTASMGGVSGAQFFGNSRNSNEAFRWASNDVYGGAAVTSALGDIAKSAFDSMSKLARMMDISTGALEQARLPFAFTVTEHAAPQGPNYDEVTRAMQANIGQLTDQMAEKLIPNIRDFAQANETLTQTFTRLANARRQADIESVFTRMNAAIKLYDDTSGLFLSNLSPLNASQRLAYSGSQYGITLAQAQSGDVNAMGRLAGAAQSYLAEARSYYASSQQYTDIFNRVMQQTQGLVADTLAQQATQFASMGLSLDDIAQNTDNLDGRIAVALNAAVGAWQTTDAVLQEQLRAALGDIGVNLSGIDVSINSELRASIAAPLREQLLQMLTASSTLAQIAGNTYNLGGTLSGAAGDIAGSVGEVLTSISTLDATVGGVLQSTLSGPLHEQLVQQAASAAALKDIAGDMKTLAADMAAQVAAKLLPAISAQVEATRQSGTTVAAAVTDAKTAATIARESVRTNVWIDGIVANVSYNSDGVATAAYNSDGDLLGPGFRVALGITSSSDG